MMTADQSDVLNFSENMVIKFGKEYKNQNIAKNSYWKVTNVDAAKNAVTLIDEEGRQIIWNPQSNWGKRFQAYKEVESELALDDKIIWTQNLKGEQLTNGLTGKIIDVDQFSKEATIQFKNGKQVVVKADEFEYSHWNHNYVTTAHAAQGMTTDRVLFHGESYRKNLISQKSFYVGLSRAKHEVVVVTDNKKELVKQLGLHSGEKQNALELEEFKPPAKELETPESAFNIDNLSGINM